MHSAAAQSDGRLVRFLRRSLVAGSVLLWLCVAACYALRFDSCAAVTVFPVWCWCLAGWALAVAGRRALRRRVVVAVTAAWLALLVAFADRPAALFRFRNLPGKPTAAGERGLIRVVSLNCAGSVRALREVGSFEPDIVLVQESPSRDQVAEFARELFGERGQFRHGPDASIIARGRITPRKLPATIAGNAAAAHIELADGKELEVVGLRLEPGIVRVDLWSRDCWREQTANRRRRRAQLDAIVGALGGLPGELPIVLGGDFNAPPGDAALRGLRPSLRDAFAEAGRGWGNTIINEIPFLRIDQIWISKHFRAVDVVSVPTQHSDHRMVVADLILP